MIKNDRNYADGPVTEVAYIFIEYGHLEEYIEWLNSTWKPTMDATKKARLIIDYELQNKARVSRSDYRKVLGTELIRELILN